MTSQLLEQAAVTWLVITCQSGQWIDQQGEKKDGRQRTSHREKRQQEEVEADVNVEKRDAVNEASGTHTAVRAADTEWDGQSCFLHTLVGVI